MNKSKREKLQRAKQMLSGALDIVEAIKDAEADALDNIPENLQGSDRFADMENAVDNLEQASENITDAIDNIGEAIK